MNTKRVTIEYCGNKITLPGKIRLRDGPAKRCRGKPCCGSVCKIKSR